MEVLTRCRHNGFPVVRSCLGDDEDSGDFDAAGQGASRSGSLQGLILRSQILVMLRHQVCTVVLYPFNSLNQSVLQVLNSSRSYLTLDLQRAACAVRTSFSDGAGLYTPYMRWSMFWL